MSFRSLITLSAVAALAAGQAPEGTPALGGPPARAFSYRGPTSGEIAGRAELVSSEGMPFQEAWRLETSSLPEKPDATTEHALRLRATGAVPVAQGDVMLARLWMRCVEAPGGECATRLVVERDASPWTKSLSRVLVSGSEWQEVRLAFSMVESYAAGQWTVSFWMGQQVQVVELGGIEVTRYPPGTPWPDLGVDTLYPGAAEDASWRREARERIEKLRKAALKIRVEDAEGRPIPGARVRVRMTRHDFGFGTAVAAQQLLGSGEDSDRYRQFILDNFNMVVFENDLKWPQWEQNRQRALDGLRWMHEHNIPWVRGHTLVWPGWRWLPGDLQSLKSDPERLRERILAHIEEIVTATRGQLVHWDVLNEPYSNRDLQNILGDEAMAEWFQEARKHDANVELYINDFNILSANGTDLAHRNHYFNTIAYLEQLGAPVQGIGMQGHFGSPTPPETMLRILDRFSLFGKPIAITEYDFETKDEELQARFFRDLLIAMFSHPNVRSFLMWGFWEGRHWRPDGAMIRRDWSEKKSYQVWRDLVFGEWWTKADVETGQEGQAEIQGFLGAYSLEAEAGGRTGRTEVLLGSGGAEAQIRLQR
jgi:GH35 family endo-1,4-beta-xylanase